VSNINYAQLYSKYPTTVDKRQRYIVALIDQRNLHF